MNRDVLEVFKAIVAKKEQKRSRLYTSLVDYGVVLDFDPTDADKALISERYKPLDMRTLFSVEERANSDLTHLIVKQLFHYWEVYGLNAPGLFDLEFDDGTIVSMTFIKSITEKELGNIVRNLLYTKAPIKDTTQILRIINHFNISYDINQVANNELRVMLFDVNNDVFNNGDDAVRWMCYTATDSALLIKSKEVEEAIKEHSFSCAFLERHTLVLSQVFNRHKRLIMSAKNTNTMTVINKISRWSKKRHIPIFEPVSKRYISGALSGQISADVLDTISIRDHFKFLNLLAYKRQGNTTDAFIIRNGKIHIEEGRKVWGHEEIALVEQAIFASLKSKLYHLRDETILLDPQVHYGLPISNKQTIGHLPFGTRIVNAGNKKISTGIYWENDWGATDLDLSTIDDRGYRTGWGQYSGYDRHNRIEFSGDITDAHSGAMEFMTSSQENYGLFVNIYSGLVGCETEIVIGTKSSKHWMDNVIIREKTKLDARGSIIGFVRDRDFIVYKGIMSANSTSGPRETAIVSRGNSDFWTINKLFDMLNINYDVDNHSHQACTVDLTYKGVTYDKLQNLFTAKEVP